MSQTPDHSTENPPSNEQLDPSKWQAESLHDAIKAMIVRVQESGDRITAARATLRLEEGGYRYQACYLRALIELADGCICRPMGPFQKSALAYLRAALPRFEKTAATYTQYLDDPPQNAHAKEKLAADLAAVLDATDDEFTALARQAAQLNLESLIPGGKG